LTNPWVINGDYDSCFYHRRLWPNANRDRIGLRDTSRGERLSDYNGADGKHPT
jgi:hypothetical protein